MKKLKISDHIIFEDDDYLAINKPPFLSTLEDRNDKFNALGLVREVYPDIKVCHRIDKETSGVLLFSKNMPAYSHAASAFEKRQVTKIYHAVVEGNINIQDVRVDEPIRLLGNGKVCEDRFEGKPATTIFSTLQLYGKHTLMQCMPLTGRMHQIRVHVAGSGNPIVGDELYGGEPFFLSSIKKKFFLKKNTEEEPLVKRFALHAFNLSFETKSSKQINIQADYPKDFRVLIKQLEANSSFR
ncbi:MAG: RNA pseudouridine synthase [Cyclobacteriaceae bacterium]